MAGEPGALEWIATINEQADLDVPYRDLPELVGDIVELNSVEAPRRASRVVTGEFTEVRRGPAFRWSERADGSEADLVELDSGSPDAEVVTYELDFVVSSEIAPRPGAAANATTGTDTIRVAISVSPAVTLDAVRRDFVDAQAQHVLFLHKSPVYDYDPELWGIMTNGAMIARVAPDLSLSYPAMNDPLLLVGDLSTTLTDLIAAGSAG